MDGGIGASATMIAAIGARVVTAAGIAVRTVAAIGVTTGAIMTGATTVRAAAVSSLKSAHDLGCVIRMAGAMNFASD